MLNQTTTKTVKITMALFTLAVITGCQHPKGPIAHGEAFNNPECPTDIGRIAQAQASAGAKADSMLYDRNFKGAALNSLGQAKLDLIAKGSNLTDPITIYLNISHDTVTARTPAVLAFFTASGFDAAKVKVVEGPNPYDNTDAAYNLGGIYKADNNSFNGEAADLSPAGAGGAMPGK